MSRIKLVDIYIGARRRKEMGDIEDMMKDLKENGQITAITVRPPTDVEREELGVVQPYVLVAGGRRTGAALMLGWEDIAAYCREDEIDEIKHRILELHENIKRKDMTWDEIAQAKLEILTLRQEMAAKEGKQITQREIAIEIGEDPATFSRDIKAAEAIVENPELKKAASRKAALRAQEMAYHHKELEARVQMNTEEYGAAQEMKRRIQCTDAGTFLRAMAPRSQDLIITDPPYMIDFYKQGQKMRAGGKDGKLGLSEYDDSEGANSDVIVDVVPLMVKVTRETGWIACFAGSELADQLQDLFSNCCLVHADYRDDPSAKLCAIAAEEGSGGCVFAKPEPKNWIWYRPNSRNNPRYGERHAKNVYEDIVVVNMGRGRLARFCDNLLVYDAEYGDERVHSMQKPLPLLEDLISRFTYYGDSICDPFFGSGSALAAGAKIGRYVSGCDKNPAMYEMALGFVAKYFTPIAANGRKSSEERYQQGLEQGREVWEEVADVTDE